MGCWDGVGRVREVKTRGLVGKKFVVFMRVEGEKVN